jgi:microcystin-dependent protein
MVNFDIKDGIDTTSSTNAYIPTGSLIIKAIAPSILSNYDTDAECIAAGIIPCDGRTLNATTYSSYKNLFNIIENIYGGTNNTNFKVPDLRTSRRYIYGQSTQSAGVYTPSLSANTTNSVTHSHTVNGMSGQNLSTNAELVGQPGVGASHTHSTSYTFSDGGSSYHSHLFEASMGGVSAGQALGTTLTKADGTGTAAGAAHTHSTGGVYLYFNSGNGGQSHSHSGSGTSNSYGEPTHPHSFTDSNVSIPTSSAIDIPYVNMLYFIKL